MSDPRWLSAVLHLLGAISWPIAILGVALLFRGSIRNLIGRVHTLKATPTGIELLLSKVEKAGLISSQAELGGLSAHDIWALDSFAGEKVGTKVDQMTPAQRVAARTLLDLSLLALFGDGPNKQVTVTPLGRQILEAAKSLLS